MRQLRRLDVRLGFRPLARGDVAADVPVLDRALQVNLDLQSLPKKGPKWSDPFMAECLRRVTGFECVYASVVEYSLGWLRKCPHFENVVGISFYNAFVVPLGVIEELYLSPAMPNITSGWR